MDWSSPFWHGCRRGLYDFDFARSYGAYSSAMARAIVLLKYQQVTPLAAFFAECLLPVVREHALQFAADVVVPVPLHPARQRERGYNQAELIARALARRLPLPCRSHLLVRTQPRPEKLRLTVHERWRSVRNAFDIRKGSQVDKLRVLLLDDVLTTGATLDACSRALREAGAAYVAAKSRSLGRYRRRQPRAGSTATAEEHDAMSSGVNESVGHREVVAPTAKARQVSATHHRRPAIMQEPVLGCSNATFEPINVAGGAAAPWFCC